MVPTEDGLVPDTTAESADEADPVSADDKGEKEKGNECYANGDIEKAVEHWGRSLRSCRYILSKDAYEGENKKTVEDALVTVSLNLALGNIKLKKYNPALTFCEDVLKIDEKNIKALYRKSQIYFEIGEYQKCKESLGRLLSCNPENSAAKKMLHEATAEHLKILQREKKMMENVFHNLESDERVTSRKKESSWSNFWTTATTTLLSWLIQLVMFLAAVCTQCCKRRGGSMHDQSHLDYMSAGERAEGEATERPQNRASRRLEAKKKKK